MADGPKIVPDPPPAEPRPVQVHPDPAPADPVPVQVGQDPPPGPTVPVAVFPDPGPWTPQAVSVNPDAGPGSPFPVQTNPDPGPTGPIAVQINPDPPPGAPFPVSVTPDPPPAPPVAVPTFPDPLHWQPTPVQTIPDPPPVAYDHRQEPKIPAPYVPPDIRSPQQIVSSFLGFEREVSKFLLSGIGFDADAGGALGSRALDPVFLVEWYKDNLKASQITSFIAEQGILHAMNDTVARIFNPAYFLMMSIPGMPGHFVPSDAQGFTNVDAALARDIVTTTEAQQALDPEENAFGPLHRMDHGLDFTVDDMVDAAVDGTGRGDYMSVLPASQNGDGIPPVMRFDATRYFDRDPSTGLMSRTRPIVKLSSNDIPPKSPLLRSEQGQNGVGIVRMGVPEEDTDGAVRTYFDPDPAQFVDDDAVRVPLYFTDLRKDPVSNSWRSVYFQAFNLNFSEGYGPEFDEKPAFGRTDPVVNYIRTTRTLTLSWEVMAFVPEDVVRMYNKMRWLSSMVYPSYTPDGLMLSGPVVRLRIGDVVGTVDGGVPGVIRNLNFDFADALWELKRRMKVPRSFQVSAELLVLHDGPVGTLNGQFGVLSLPPPGTSPGDVNYAPQDNRQTTAAKVLPGRFARFGEPIRRG